MGKARSQTVTWQRVGSLALSLLLGAGVVRELPAQPQSLFQAHYDLAVRLYLSARYEEALKEFQAAHAAQPTPRLLVNIGTAQRRLGRGKEALASYEAYLQAEPNLPESARQSVEKAMAEARALVAQAQPASPPPTDAGKRTGTPRQKQTPDFTLLDVRSSDLSRPLNMKWLSIAGGAADDLWFAGTRGQLLHFDGKTSSRKDSAWPGRNIGGSVKLLRVYGTAPDSVWTFGRGHDGPLLLHFDGDSWSSVPLTLLDDSEVIGLWARSITQVWMMNRKGAVLRFDGTNWIQASEDSGTAILNLQRVFALSPEDVWAVGDNGAIVHWDGKRLTHELCGTRSALFGLWASGPRDIWAAGENRSLCHYDGKTWTATQISTPTAGNPAPEQPILALWGSGPRDLWAAGGPVDEVHSAGFLLHYDGKLWSPALPVVRNGLHDLWGSGPRDVWAVGWAGLLLHYDGVAWSERAIPRLPPGLNLESLWGSDPRNLWAVGDDGMILHGDGEQWDVRHSRPAEDLYLWRLAADDIWAIGKYLHHYDGKSWTTSPSATSLSVNAVWGLPGGSELWAVGDKGSVARYSEKQWRRLTSGTTEILNGVWGSGPAELWTVGDHGTALHYTGGSFSAVDVGLGDQKLRQVAGSGPADIWVRGDFDLVHFDGKRWQKVALPKQYDPNALLVDGPQQVWLAGMAHGDQLGTVLRRVGSSSWKSYRTPTSRPILSLFHPSGRADELWGAGEDGTILFLGHPQGAARE